MIDEAWKNYEASSIPASAPRIQRLESRRAFYAGALALLSGLACGVDDSDGVSEADLQLMDNVHAELKEFARAVESGEA